MNDLQALKCMNEQPERNVRLDGEAPSLAAPAAIAVPREFMASKQPDASAAPHQIAFERFFNPLPSPTRSAPPSHATNFVF
jgi:hypothetical protein